MKALIDNIFVLLFTLLTISCSNAKSNNQKTNNNMTGIEQLLEKQILHGYGWGNEITDIPDDYFFTNEDLEITASLIYDYLQKQGFKNNRSVFRKKVSDIFHISDTLAYQISIDRTGNSAYTTNISLEMFQKELVTNLFISPQFNIIIYPYYLPEIIDYKTLYPPIAMLEEKVSTEQEKNKDDAITIYKWRDLEEDLKSKRKDNLTKMFHINNYLFNDNRASLVWLAVNESDFLKNLLLAFSYDKEDKINKMVLDDDEIGYINLFASKDINGKLQIKTGLMETVAKYSTKEYSNYYQILSKYVDKLSEINLQNELVNNELQLRFSQAERRKIIAYAVNTLQPLYEKFNPECIMGEYGALDKHGVGINDAFWYAMFHDRGLLKEIEKHDCYGLPALSLFIKKMRDDTRFINEETKELEPWKFNPNEE